MKAKKKLQGAVVLGVNVEVDKSLDKLSGKILFPGRLVHASQPILRHKFPYIHNITL
ncbi:hypothetical protein HHL17_21865 [Chitinophaga sp. G-6-1-13]|uniref:Uncharacterized protein n=1 Tax=Chitinophaga fulva TaxID=2728842 RepID=A0A848GRY7_9BACT|nr:hypothetical protein [Chitinophaga fulva]NML39862.1 hypothetical protein [Chitinophaga fulva]